MKKETIRWGIGMGVLLVLYLLLVFLIPFVHTATFWVSFVFSLVAFAVVALSVYNAFIKNPDARSKFYGFPIAKIGMVYVVVQLVAGFLFMALSAYAPVRVAVLVYAIALGAAVIGLVSADAVAAEVLIQDEKLKKDVSLMRGLYSKASQMAGQCESPDAAAAVRKFADEMRYSDPVSSDALAEVEGDLAAAVDELQSAIADGDSAATKQLCRKASALLTERNRLCRLNK